MEKWYVTRSKPRSEEILWRQYCLRNIESYYPCINVIPVNPRSRKTQPYFPGYLFVHVDLGVVGRSALEWIPGGAGLVSFEDEPASVPESLIFTLRQRLDDLAAALLQTIAPRLRKGDAVAIQDGAFMGYEAIFDLYLAGTDRVRVLLQFLENRPIPVEMPACYLQRI
jgi:transcriptional antiterminator RfaH